MKKPTISDPNELSNQLPQHILQNPAVLVIVDLVGSVDTCDGLELLFLAGLISNANVDEHPRFDAGRNTLDIESFKSSEVQSCRTFAIFELQRKHSHSDEIAAM